MIKDCQRNWTPLVPLVDNNSTIRRQQQYVGKFICEYIWYAVQIKLGYNTSVIDNSSHVQYNVLPVSVPLRRDVYCVNC